MVYDVQDIDKQLDKYLKLNKKLQYLESYQKEDMTMEIEKLKNKLILIETRINLIKPQFENPDIMKYQFTGCAFVTLKTQNMVGLIKKYYNKKFFFEEINDDGKLVKITKNEKLLFNIRKAPEPTDIIWENFEKSHSKWKWFIISILFSLVINTIFLFLIKNVKDLHVRKESTLSNNILKNVRKF